MCEEESFIIYAILVTFYVSFSLLSREILSHPQNGVSETDETMDMVL